MNLQELFSQNPYFHKKIITKDEVIFNEGEQNPYLFIIESGKVVIEKYTTTEHREFKELAILGVGDTFGEACLSNNLPKESRARVLSDGVLFMIDAQSDMTSCMKDYPTESLTLLNEIISLTNKRLLLANREITVNSELQKTISQLEKIDLKNLLVLIDQLKNIFGCDYILYIEKSAFLSDAIVIRYDTRTSPKLQDIAIRFPADFTQDILEENGINLGRYTLIQKLILGDQTLGYLIFGNLEKMFTDSDKRITQSLSNSIAGIIHQMKIGKEERDRQYMKGN